MFYSISQNDKVDNIFISHLNTILDLLQQVEDYTMCDDKSIFMRYGITRNDIITLVDNIKIKLNTLYERYLQLGYSDLDVAHHFKTCYEKLYLVA